MKKILDINSLEFASDGRLILSSEELVDLEAEFTSATAGGVNTICDAGQNGSCNNIECNNSTNTDLCRNGICEGASNAAHRCSVLQ